MSDFDKSALSEVNWVFGYGSLIWRPGFDFVDRAHAVLPGVHRSLCIYSHRYRGTPEKPGLVFGLEPGGSCEGMAFEVDPPKWKDVCEYLWEREQFSGVYVPSLQKLELKDGRRVTALTFLANPTNAQYAGGLSVDDQVSLVRRSVGKSGGNIEYVLNTAQHLQELGTVDQQLIEICDLLKAEV